MNEDETRRGRRLAVGQQVSKGATKPERLIVYGSGAITADCPITRLDAWATHCRIASPLVACEK